MAEEAGEEDLVEAGEDLVEEGLDGGLDEDDGPEKLAGDDMTEPGERSAL